MSKGKNETTLAWDDFIKLGNPENAPEEVEENDKEGAAARKSMRIRLHLEKKGRGGKEAIIIRGIEESEDELKEISKKIKTKLGVGGSAKEGEVIIQGGDRTKITEILKQMGFSDIKNSGG